MFIVNLQFSGLIENLRTTTGGYMEDNGRWIGRKVENKKKEERTGKKWVKSKTM